MARASQPLGAVRQSARPLVTLITRRTEMLTSRAPVKSARVNCDVAGSQNAGSLVGGLFTLHSCTTTFVPGVNPLARTRHELTVEELRRRAGGDCRRGGRGQRRMEGQLPVPRAEGGRRR